MSLPKVHSIEELQEIAKKTDEKNRWVACGLDGICQVFYEKPTTVLRYFRGAGDGMICEIDFELVFIKSICLEIKR